MKLYIVGIGAGSRNGMTLQAEAAIQESQLIVGYTVYIRQIKAFFPEKECLSTGMRQERERVRLALEAAKTKTTALVCSGDAAVYGMAELALTMAEADTELEIVPGVTAAFSGGAILGAPLSNDFAVISLSDLLTPWEKILQRLHGAAAGDFVIVLYNPSSSQRREHLRKACDILLQYKPENTVCGYVRNIGRDGEEHRILSLGELRNTSVDMFTTVFVGNTATREIHGRMVTERGYS